MIELTKLNGKLQENVDLTKAVDDKHEKLDAKTQRKILKVREEI